MESCSQSGVTQNRDRKNPPDFTAKIEKVNRAKPHQNYTGATLDRKALRRYKFTYTAREAGEAGLMFYRARYYNPGIGRFTSEDPLGFVDLAPYPYVRNNPILRTDPSGATDTAAGIPPSKIRIICGPNIKTGCVVIDVNVFCQCYKTGCLEWKPVVFEWMNSRIYWATDADISEQFRRVVDMATFVAKQRKALDDLADALRKRTFMFKFTCDLACQDFYRAAAKLGGSFGY